MYKELDHIDVQVTLDWREQFKMLKLKFPINLIFRKTTYEIPYGHIERAMNGEEEPGQAWIDISGITPQSGEQYGISLLNDGKYSFDVMNSEMNMTVLRSPIYAHHDPLVPKADGHYSFIDQGIQRFNYTLVPHVGGWEAAGTVKRAAELNQKPIVLVETYHDGPLPQINSFLSVDQDNIIVSVVKKAEDSDDTVIRCYETNKVATQATIHLPHLGRVIEVHFGPCEIKTLLISKDLTKPVVETNLLEWTD